MYTITLNDGTKIEGLTLKNNCLVSSNVLTDSQFAGKLNPVTITGTKGADDDDDIGSLVGTHEHMQLAYIKLINGKYHLALGDIDDKDWENERLRAVVDYLAMTNSIVM